MTPENNAQEHRHNPRRMAAVAGAALALSVGVSFGAGQNVDRAHVDRAAGSRAIVTGCHAEDACRIDYRGNGRWVITRNR